MRVAIPLQEQGAAAVAVGKLYAQDITAAAYRYSQVTYEHSKLSLREFEAGRARTAEINGCLLCQGFRVARDLPGYLSYLGSESKRTVASHGPAPDEMFYRSVSNWKTAPIFSVRERLVIEYAEGMGLNPHGIAADDGFWHRAKTVFSDEEIVDLTFCMACWIGLGRAMHVLALDGACQFGQAAA